MRTKSQLDWLNLPHSLILIGAKKRLFSTFFDDFAIYGDFNSLYLRNETR